MFPMAQDCVRRFEWLLSPAALPQPFQLGMLLAACKRKSDSWYIYLIISLNKKSRGRWLQGESFCTLVWVCAICLAFLQTPTSMSSHNSTQRRGSKWGGEELSPGRPPAPIPSEEVSWPAQTNGGPLPGRWVGPSAIPEQNRVLLARGKPGTPIHSSLIGVRSAGLLPWARGMGVGGRFCPWVQGGKRDLLFGTLVCTQARGVGQKKSHFLSTYCVPDPALGDSILSYNPVLTAAL